jgi:hypothetical protein
MAFRKVGPRNAEHGTGHRSRGSPREEQQERRSQGGCEGSRRLLPPLPGQVQERWQRPRLEPAGGSVQHALFRPRERPRSDRHRVRPAAPDHEDPDREDPARRRDRRAQQGQAGFASAEEEDRRGEEEELESSLLRQLGTWCPWH